MAKGQSAPDVRALEDSYKIVGELRGSEGTRKYMATRLADGAEVIISVLTAPRGAEGNELSHFAADVQLLASLDHPSMARMFEARWIGSTLAVVSARVQGTTLAEALDSGEQFSNPRAAEVLQEVWSVLDWARTSGVVHRGVTPDNVYFAPGADRVTLVLGPTAIPVEGVNDARGDARTIGALAWSMLTGKTYRADDQSRRLADLAPNLAIRVVDATETMVHGASSHEDEIDVPTFVGIIAAGDVLKQAEVEIAAMKEDYQEEHRIALASCENQRLETERWANDQAALLASERDEFERTMTQHQEQLAAVRNELHDRTASLEKWIREFEVRREEIIRLRAAQVDELAEARRAREAADAEARTRRESPRERESHRDRNENIRSIVGAPVKAAALPPKPPAPRATREPTASDGAGRRWALSATVVVLLLVVAGVVGAIVYRRFAAARVATVAAQPVAPPSVAAGNPPPQSAGGTVAPTPIVPPVAPPQDSAVSAAQAPVDRPPPETPRPSAPRPRPEPRPANDVSGTIPGPVVTPPRDSVVPRDSIWVRTDSTIAHDSARRDSMGRPDTAGYVRDTTRLDSTRLDSMRRDSAAKGDSVARRDSALRRDTSAARDTTRIRPDSIVRIPP